MKQCFKSTMFTISKPVSLVDCQRKADVHIISTQSGDVVALIKDNVVGENGITFCIVEIKNENYSYMQDISWMKDQNVWLGNGQGNNLQVQNYDLMGKSWWYDQSFTQWIPVNEPVNSPIIVTVGDSITAGYHCEASSGQCQGCSGDCQIVSDATFFYNGQQRTITSPNCSLSFQDYLLQKYWPNAMIYNYGAPGTTAMLPSSATASLCDMNPCSQTTLFAGPYTGYTCWNQLLNGSLNPDVITFMLGTNDAIYGNQNCWGGEGPAVQQTYTSIKNMITQLSTAYPDATIWLLRPIPNFNEIEACGLPNPNTINQTYASMKSEIYDVLVNQGLTNLYWFDLWTALTSRGVTKETADQYYCDKTHPYDNLNEIIADVLYEAIQPVQMQENNGKIVYTCVPPVYDYTPQ